MFLLDRFKAVKYVVFTKLDDLSSRLDSLQLTLEKILFQIQSSLQASLQNDNSLLQASIRQIKNQQKFQRHYSNQLEVLNREIETFDNKLNFFKKDIANISLKSQQQIDLLTQNELFIRELKAKFDTNLDSLSKKIDSQPGHIKVIETQHLQFYEPEVGLVTYLYSYLPSRKILDIGANVGLISEEFLKVGYEVYAFEPNPPTFEKMKKTLENYAEFHPYQFAIGSSDSTMELFVVEELSEQRNGGDPSLYSSLRKHPLVDGLEFRNSVNVPVRSLASLHHSTEIPHDISLVKIDTEGYDIEVIRGMGEFNYPVVSAEFWDEDHAFGSKEGTSLVDLVDIMRKRNYHWYVVIYRKGLYDAAFYCNIPVSIEESWGNVFFFQTHSLFCDAMKWCSATLPYTFFKGSNSQ